MSGEGEKPWDAKPFWIVYKGQECEMFLKSALAKALNREIGSIRNMERQGVLCHPPLRNHRQRWLYSRSQIEDLIKLAEQEDVIDPRFRHPFSERFKREARAICKRKPI